MKTLQIIFVIVLSWGSLSAQNLEQVFKDYMVLENYLVEGNQNEALSSAMQLINSLENLEGANDQKTLINEIITSAKTIAKSGKVEQQRNEFGKLSESFWKLIKANKSFQIKAYYNYCPMKKAYWISDVKDIRNPFYGKQMLQCGSVKESIN